MTAKEKALKLCQDFGYLGMESKQTEYYTLDLELAKRCAMICVDETIQAMTKLKEDYTVGTYWHPIDWWKEVKEEVQKL